MAPGYNTTAFIIIIGLPHNLGNFSICLNRCLVNQWTRQVPAFTHGAGHFSAPGRNCFKNFLAIQKLTAYYKPEFSLLHKSSPPKFNCYTFSHAAFSTARPFT